jgi:hypothetical protein
MSRAGRPLRPRAMANEWQDACARGRRGGAPKPHGKADGGERSGSTGELPDLTGPSRALSRGWTPTAEWAVHPSRAVNIVP